MEFIFTRESENLFCLSMPLLERLEYFAQTRSAEVYPTYVRTVGLTTCSMVSRITSAIAPYVADLDSGPLSWVPTVIFSAAGVLGGAVMLCLPEMRDETLPETICDADEVGTGSSTSVKARQHKAQNGHSQKFIEAVEQQEDVR